ncbi:MAG TPA: GNAT family N-acetyltransferase [Actinomycetota bacterium]|nr:GNAT family N-acetyltransferase [Actinomycetota bacterium]
MQVRPLTEADARSIATWRYPGRYATYDVGVVLDPADGFCAVQDEGRLVGYGCFGAEARVPGVGEESGTLDIGYGMRPDLMGRGLGPAFAGAIVAFGVATFGPDRLRLLILEWNERSRKVAERLGFERDGSVLSDEGRFLVMRRAP